MTRQTLLGILFLLIGVAIIVAVLAPVGLALVATPPMSAPSISFPLLVTGIALAVFGAWLIPSSGVGATVTQVRVVLSETSLPFVGRSAAPPAGTGSSQVIATVTTHPVSDPSSLPATSPTPGQPVDGP